MRRAVLSFRQTTRDTLFGRTALAWRWVAAGAVLAGTASVCFVAWQAALVRSDLTTTRDALVVARVDEAALSSRSVADSPAMRQRTQALNRIVRSLNAPWSDIFDALEVQVQPDVALVSIEPDSVKASVRIEAEGKRLEGLLRYARRLGESPQFRSVVLLRHEQNERDEARPFRMSLDVSFRPRSTATGAPSS